MDQSCRFKIVFTKLQGVLEEDARKDAVISNREFWRTREVSAAELDEIDELRRIILEATEPQMMSFTTT